MMQISAVIKCLETKRIGGTVLTDEAIQELTEKVIGVSVYLGKNPNPEEPRLVTDLIGCVSGVEGESLIIEVAQDAELPDDFVAQIDVFGEGLVVAGVPTVYHIVTVPEVELVEAPS